MNMKPNIWQQQSNEHIKIIKEEHAKEIAKLKDKVEEQGKEIKRLKEENEDLKAIVKNLEP